jgi:hypothetical protein
MSVKVWDPAIALPKDLDDALQLISQLETFQEKPNPKFLALAHALLADSAFAGHWGAERILEEAENCTCAIWEPQIPAGDGMPAIRAVIQHATSLGLVAYRESRQVVFLPGGGTVTPAQKALHDGDFEDYDSRLHARAKVCQTLVDGFREHFAPLGFLPSNLDPTEFNRFAALSFYDRHLGEFSRRTRDGWQRLLVGVNHHDADSPYFECSVRVGVRSEPVETIFTHVFGEGNRRVDTFFFGPAIFLRDRADGFEATNESLMRELPALVERLAMPVLDLASEPVGLDEVMNIPSRFPFNYPLDPLTPQNLADSFVSCGRQSCLKTLIAAWLVRSPHFEARVASLREFVKTRVDVSENDLDKLVTYLRTSSL